MTQTDDQTLDILKEAILLERRGHAFYRKVASETDNSAVQCFFQIMADEETKHIGVLSDQYKAYQTNGRFAPDTYNADAGSGAAEAVLGEKMRAQIAAAEFEAAAISAAIAMEQRAVDLYEGRAKSANDPEEKALYAWLARWEREHLSFLIDMDRELTQQIWHDNQFWPF